MELLSSHGLTRHEGEVLAHLVLDWLADYSQANPGLGPRLEDLANFAARPGDIPLLKAHASTIQQALISKHYVSIARGITGPWDESLRLLPIGQLEAERVRHQRSASGPRHLACRHALLAWLGDRDVQVPDPLLSLACFTTDPLSFFWGEPFSETDIDRAAQWLHDNGMIERRALHARLTSGGGDCVSIYGGDIGLYIRSTSMSGGQIINVHGSNSGQIGMAGQGNVTQEHQQGIDIEKLMAALNGVREALPVLKLEPEDAAELTETMDEIEAKGKGGTLTEVEKKSFLTRMKTLIRHPDRVWCPSS
ncbi:hypothetical protein ACIBEJ_30345 [Nonomuraea sp. NPDC050790]|uniref:hypothetical protein n=1 Tax=Nonomuraea sp. NPDC050790 TaxID=3364371 RepID=UPI0037B10569